MIIRYRLCRCYVWPVAAYSPVGKCGRCNTYPYETSYATKEEAVAAFAAEHRREPEPIRKK